MGCNRCVWYDKMGYFQQHNVRARDRRASQVHQPYQEWVRMQADASAAGAKPGVPRWITQELERHWTSATLGMTVQS